MGPIWCVVMSKPLAEEVAEKTIRAAGHAVYLPRSSKILRGYDEDRTTGRKTRATSSAPVMRPAFRGYLFFELHPDQQWRHLLDSRNTRGVANIITRGDRPVLIQPEIIDAIREQETAGEFDEPRGLRLRGTSKRRSDLSDGDTVRIGTGPFAGFLAELHNQDDLGRAHVLVQMLGRIVTTQTDAKSLEKIDEAA